MSSTRTELTGREGVIWLVEIAIGLACFWLVALLLSPLVLRMAGRGYSDWVFTWGPATAGALVAALMSARRSRHREWRYTDYALHLVLALSLSLVLCGGTIAVASWFVGADAFQVIGASGPAWIVVWQLTWAVCWVIAAHLAVAGVDAWSATRGMDH